MKIETWAWGLLMLLLGGCIEELELPTEARDPVLVMEGFITPEHSYVDLSFISNSNLVSQPISGAEVRIVNSAGNAWVGTETEPGHYEISTQGLVEPGQAYLAEAVLPNGESYRSSPDTVPAGIASDEVDWRLGQNRGRRVMRVFSRPFFPESPAALRSLWRITDAYVQTPTDFPDPFNDLPPNCYIEQQPDLQRIPLLDGSPFAGQQVERVVVGEIFLDPTFDEKHVISVEQYSLSAPSYAYWVKAAQLLAQRGSLFDTPPALLPGNVSGEQLGTREARGYVSAALYQVTRFAVYPSDLPGTFLDPCEYQPGRRYYPNECTRCIALRGSSFDPPDYFFDVR